MGRAAVTVQPYEYASEPHRRRHGPAGYTEYSSYLPWLKDEFSFRCVYCLKRIVWAPTDQWVVDHSISRAEAPELECEYDNLVLACQFCNGRKGSNRVPDPSRVAYGRCLRVEEDGTIAAIGEDGSGNRLINVLRLNHPWQVEQRRNLIKILARVDQELFIQLMGYPSDLCDLRKLRNPDNRRPDGLQNCHFARRERCELPAVY